MKRVVLIIIVVLILITAGLAVVRVRKTNTTTDTPPAKLQTAPAVTSNLPCFTITRSLLRGNEDFALAHPASMQLGVFNQTRRVVKDKGYIIDLETHLKIQEGRLELSEIWSVQPTTCSQVEVDAALKDAKTNPPVVQPLQNPLPYPQVPACAFASMSDPFAQRIEPIPVVILSAGPLTVGKTIYPYYRSYTVADGEGIDSMKKKLPYGVIENISKYKLEVVPCSDGKFPKNTFSKVKGIDFANLKENAGYDNSPITASAEISGDSSAVSIINNSGATEIVGPKGSRQSLAWMQNGTPSAPPAEASSPNPSPKEGSNDVVDVVLSFIPIGGISIIILILLIYGFRALRRSGMQYRSSRSNPIPPSRGTIVPGTLVPATTTPAASAPAQEPMDDPAALGLTGEDALYAAYLRDCKLHGVKVTVGDVMNQFQIMSESAQDVVNWLKNEVKAITDDGTVREDAVARLVAYLNQPATA